MLMNSFNRKLYGPPMQSNYPLEPGFNLLKSYPAFKTGGIVKRTGLALIHKNEYILPKGIKPTKAQREKVNKLKKK